MCSVVLTAIATVNASAVLLASGMCSQRRLGVDQCRHGRLGHRAQAQAGQGHTELATGKIKVEPALDIPAHAVDQAAGFIGLDSAGPRRNRGEFGRDEIAIERDQR
jgi:hypothetical protein